MIYCGYQGCGKTTYCKNHSSTAVDLDSHMFAKENGWERNYIKVAKALSDCGKQVFISAHRVVILCLIEQGIPFELLIPAQSREVWRARLDFRYQVSPTAGNFNALKDFEQNFDDDMKFYAELDCIKHEISARVVTDITNCIN